MTFKSGVDRPRFALAMTVAPLAISMSAERTYAMGDSVLPAISPGAHARVVSFRLGQVGLIDGPFRDAELWNRAFMLRVAPERLLHSFRINAGLPVEVAPLTYVAETDSGKVQFKPLNESWERYSVYLDLSA